MSEMELKSALKRSPVFGPINAVQRAVVYRRWALRGRPVPPPHEIKQRVVLEYADRFNLRSFVETGTYRGKMIFAVRNRFDRIFSIELDAGLAERARNIFTHDKHVTIVEGDSGRALPEVLEKLDAPTLFWLDGHYSGPGTARGALDTPIAQELLAITAHGNGRHVILVDDARLFTGDRGYPTLQDLEPILAEAPTSWQVDVADDVIRITPADSG